MVQRQSPKSLVKGSIQTVLASVNGLRMKKKDGER